MLSLSASVHHVLERFQLRDCENSKLLLTISIFRSHSNLSFFHGMLYRNLKTTNNNYCCNFVQ